LRSSPVLACSKTFGFFAEGLRSLREAQAKAQAKNLRFLKGGSKIEDFYAPFLAPTVREECKKQAYKNRRFL
jgi:hypothetical protein